MDYEPEDPPTFSPTVDKLSEPEDRLLTPEQGPADISPPEDDLGANSTEDAVMTWQKRRRNFQEEEEQRRKAAKDDSAAPPGGGGEGVRYSWSTGRNCGKPTNKYFGGK